MPRHRRGWAAGSPAGSPDGPPGAGPHRGGPHGRGGPHAAGLRSPLTISMLEPALLVLLQEQPRHGYSLLGDLEALGLGGLHPSVVYRALREMEALGWIASDWDTTQTQGPPRKMVRLTVDGEMALRNWQQELDWTRGLISTLLARMR